MRYTKDQIAESLACLRKLCRPGTTVYTTVKHVSSSGMSRRIALYVTDDNGVIVQITWDVARVLGYPIKGRAGYVHDVGLTVGGCGMDMCLHVVNSLSYAIHGHKSVGADAIDAGSKGRPFTARPGHYRAGYSLSKRDL